jgi:hypothetical protein
MLYSSTMAINGFHGSNEIIEKNKKHFTYLIGSSSGIITLAVCGYCTKNPKYMITICSFYIIRSNIYKEESKISIVYKNSYCILHT